MAHPDDLETLQDSSARLLAEALDRVLERLGGASDVRKFVEAHRGWFETFEPGGEHLLEWTEIHRDYCEIAERAIADELAVSGCSEDALLDHAFEHGFDVAGDDLLAKLVARTDYEQFCAMMHGEACGVYDATRHESGVSRGAAADDDDDDDDVFDGEFEYVEEVEDEVDAGEEDEDETLEGLERAVMTSALLQVEKLDEALGRLEVREADGGG